MNEEYKVIINTYNQQMKKVAQTTINILQTILDNQESERETIKGIIEHYKKLI